MSLNIRHKAGAASAIARWAGHAKARLRLGRDRRGGMAVLVAVTTPILVAFGGLAVGAANYQYNALLMRQTVQSAALAAGNKLSTYYSNNGSTATIVAAAQSFAQANMPTTPYGTVVPAGNVTVGTWSGSSFTGGGTAPNAVQVTGLMTSANGNPLNMLFGNMFGYLTADLSTTVVASYSTAQPFHTIVINDLSQSFSSEISTQRSIDNAILNCVKGSAGSTSQFGVTAITGHATVLQSLTQATTNLGILQTLIGTLTGCGGLLMPSCSGSNIAAGLHSAISQFSGSSYALTKRNIVIITDGVPNASHGVTYTTADGLSCGSHCSDQDLQDAAKAQAALAKTAGINISTIYYSGNTNNQSDQATYSNYLATLVTGGGTALVAPTVTSLTSSSSGICATIPAAVKMVM